MRSKNRMNLLEISTTSPHFVYEKCVGTAKENINCDLFKTRPTAGRAKNEMPHRAKTAAHILPYHVSGTASP